MLIQSVLNATQTLYFMALIFNLPASKFEFTIHLLVYAGDFYPLLLPNDFFLKELDFD